MTYNLSDPAASRRWSAPIETKYQLDFGQADIKDKVYRKLMPKLSKILATTRILQEIVQQLYAHSVFDDRDLQRFRNENVDADTRTTELLWAVNGSCLPIRRRDNVWLVSNFVSQRDAADILKFLEILCGLDGFPRVSEAIRKCIAELFPWVIIHERKTARSSILRTKYIDENCSTPKAISTTRVISHMSSFGQMREDDDPCGPLKRGKRVDRNKLFTGFADSIENEENVSVTAGSNASPTQRRLCRRTRTLSLNSAEINENINKIMDPTARPTTKYGNTVGRAIPTNDTQYVQYSSIPAIVRRGILQRSVSLPLGSCNESHPEHTTNQEKGEDNINHLTGVSTTPIAVSQLHPGNRNSFSETMESNASNIDDDQLESKPLLADRDHFNIASKKNNYTPSTNQNSTVVQIDPSEEKRTFPGRYLRVFIKYLKIALVSVCCVLGVGGIFLFWHPNPLNTNNTTEASLPTRAVTEPSELTQKIIETSNRTLFPSTKIDKSVIEDDSGYYVHNFSRGSTKYKTL